MTIPEAAQLVIQAGSMGHGGDVFVLDMGEPVKIVELAEKMIHLSGLAIRSEKNPHGDISIEFTGLRPGEKLYEELLIGDNVVATEHPMIMSASEDYLAWDVLKGRLVKLLDAVERDDYNSVRQLLRETVSGYTPEVKSLTGCIRNAAASLDSSPLLFRLINNGHTLIDMATGRNAQLLFYG